jgi:hypothetical protein
MINRRRRGYQRHWNGRGAGFANGERGIFQHRGVLALIGKAQHIHFIADLKRGLFAGGYSEASIVITNPQKLARLVMRHHATHMNAMPIIAFRGKLHEAGNRMRGRLELVCWRGRFNQHLNSPGQQQQWV